MPEPNVIAVSLIAMGAVFTLLAVMAVLIAVITRVFPGKAAPPPSRRKRGAASPAETGTDAAVVAAISSAAARAYPDHVVTRIEENR